ncbi:MAG: hypothetical protein KDC42_01870 [Ignavibacteriae bacterium]|nr:hypothetical protein [Ignavibacteriota bacterium]
MEEPIIIRHRLISFEKFRKRLMGSLFYCVIILGFSLLVGILGYRMLAGLNWMDSILNASMILSGMGPVASLNDDGAKLFASAYSLFSGVMFLTGIAVFVAPIMHRLIVKFHIHDVADDDKIS